MMTQNQAIKIRWKPQPRQLVALRACGLDFPFTENTEPRPAIADVIGYGGAAGGGKTDTMLAIAIIACLAFPGINVAYFRRQFPQLEGVGGAINRSLELISHIAKYNAGKHVWKFPNGSIIQFSHCQNPNDVYNYQSQQIDILLGDEVTQFTAEMIDYLLTRNRKTVRDKRFRPFAFFATNPGNIGHAWFKERFITIGEYEKLHDFMYETGVVLQHYFIQSYLDDNQKLVRRDPGYSNRLGTNELNRKMLLGGDWDVYQGQAFSECRREIHLIDPFEITQSYRLFGAYDHGFSHPFSFGIFAVDGDGNVYLVRHVSDRLKRPNQIAKMMLDSFDLKRLDYIAAGHDIWSRGRDGSPTPLEQFMKVPGIKEARVPFIKAKVDRALGASQVRDFLAWKEVTEDENGNLIDGNPKFYIFKPYQSVYDTIARMIFDPNKPEDVLKVDADENGKGGDDEYDMARYGLMSRPKPLPQREEKYPDQSGMALLRQHWEQKRVEQELRNWR